MGRTSRLEKTWRLKKTCRIAACLASGLALTNQASAAVPATAASEIPDLSPLSIEELSNLEITSVSKRAQPVSSAPAAIYVITPDEMRRVGAITIPDALALAPNLIVRRENATTYAISARGFTSFEASNKLLAMIDGRSIYSSLHSGVYWNRYDTMLDDIARIEVVSGPGGTLWGANAVNGIINIITKSSRDTQGGFLKIDGGSLDAMASARYGGQINDDLTYRFYVKGIRHGSMDTATGANAGDGYHTVQGGFRSDWERGGDDVTVQGDLLGGDSNTSGQTTQSGGNMLARWRHDGENSSTSAQVYYDAVKAASPGVDEVVRTYDVDVQHNHAFGAHEIVIGGGYRSVADKFTNVLNPFVFADPHRTTDLENLYAQDTVALTDALHVIGGVKFEHNDFTGWEIMPNARVSWQPVANQLLWASISRSVRTPSRIDRELQALPLLVPATTFRSEQLLAYEAGYRTQPSPRFSWSVSTYYNVYQDIRDTGFAPGGGLPIQFANNYHGHIYGVETWASFAVTPWWQLEAGLNTMHKDLVLKPGHISTSVDQSLGNDPDYDASLRSAMTFETVNLDVRLHFADALPSPIVPAYTELSARIAWRPSDRLELAIDGQNLLHDHHAETGLPTIRAEIPRSVSGTVTWSF